MHARKPEFKDLIERALHRELVARRELRPHAQLAIPPNASRATIEEAYSRLRARYDEKAFAEYGPSAVGAAKSIAELLRTAYDAMLAAGGAEITGLTKLQPGSSRRDETCRALETLRGAIARRLTEADDHLRAGRLKEALRVFESVLILDRQNETAQQAVAELRIALEPKRPNTFSRMFGRLFRRRALAGEPPGAVGG